MNDDSSAALLRRLRVAQSFRFEQIAIYRRGTLESGTYEDTWAMEADAVVIELAKRLRERMGKA